MKRAIAQRHLDWDRLESRSCPSHALAQASVPIPPPSVPIERLKPYAIERHHADLVEAATGRNSIVFFGDSITDRFGRGVGAAAWRRQIAPLGAADFGIERDSSQNLLWRVDNGELAGKPKVAVLMIGTNNLTLTRSVGDTVAGIEAVVAAIRAGSPGTRIVLMGLLPRASAPIGAEIPPVNAALAADAERLGVTYLDIDAAFLRPDGSIVPGMLVDGEHPTARGYQAWALAMRPVLVDLLRAPAR